VFEFELEALTRFLVRTKCSAKAGQYSYSFVGKQMSGASIGSFGVGLFLLAAKVRRHRAASAVFC
jgi:hypothetical protein